MMRVSLLSTGALAWVKTENAESVCAEVTSDSVVSIGETGTKCTTETEAPEEYLSMKVEALAILEDSAEAYLTNGAKIRVVEARPNGRTVFATETLKYGDTEIGSTSAGAEVGSSDSGGFVGTASYLVLKGGLSYNTNDFLLPGNNKATVCVVGGSKGICGANRTATAGDYKFSLYGYTEGQNFSMPDAAKYIGFRQRVSLEKMGANPMVKINDGAYMNLTEMAKSHDMKTDVTSISFKGSKTELVMTMAKDFISGTMEGGKPVLKGTDKVVIHAISLASLPAGQFFLHYLIKLDEHIRAEGKTGAGPHSYFVYDPSVSSSKKPAAATTASAAFGATASVLVAGLTMLLL